MGTPILKSYAPPALNRAEVLRYAGARRDLPELDALLSECLSEAEKVLSYNVCFTEFPINISGDICDLGFAETVSSDLALSLGCCGSIVLFAATVGVGIDRLIARYGSTAPTKSLLFQAIGAERIESLCGVFNEEITVKYGNTTPRFSPGYGNLPLTLQRDIFRVLNCPRALGLTLNDSLLMSPSKSVTAVIGIGGERTRKNHDCANCSKLDCEYRRKA